MPLRINERPPNIFPVTKPREMRNTGKKGTESITKPDKRQFLNKVAKQQSKPVGGHASYKAPSNDLHHQSGDLDRSAENKSYADHFFQIRRGHNNTSVRADYHHKQAIDPKQYFRQ